MGSRRLAIPCWIRFTALAGLSACLLLGQTIGQDSPRDSRKKEGAPPPLVVDRKAPLLLEESEKPSPTQAVSADNEVCYVCHGNYREEALALRHAEKDIGCVDCHGESQAHQNDENNTTPPDVMFPAKSIDGFCRKCHASHDVPAHQVVARWRQRVEESPRDHTLVCTDCHGNHRLKSRDVRWNKRSRTLENR